MKISLDSIQLLKISLIAMTAVTMPSWASDTRNTVKLFKRAPGTAHYFKHSVGYAVFPSIGRAGFIVGGAGGDGYVYRRGRLIGSARMSQITLGWQVGAQAYSQIIFFRNNRALNRFKSSEFAFSAEASAVAITAGAGVQAGSVSSEANASLTRNHAATAGRWYRGMAVFTIAQGGLMYQATIGGQKFSFTGR